MSAKANYLNSNYTNKIHSTSYDHELIEYIFSLGKIELTGAVLDLACGTGSFRSVFEKLNLDYYGVDIDNEDTKSSIVRCDIANTRLPYPNEYFEVVFFKMGIEHLTISEISYCLSEVKRVLKNSGKLIVITPDWKWTYSIFFEEYTHQTPFMKKSLDTALLMSGYKCVFCDTIVQLPIVWKYPMIEYFCNIASLIYPVTKKFSKFVKYSKERPLLAVAMKAS